MFAKALLESAHVIVRGKTGNEMYEIKEVFFCPSLTTGSVFSFLVGLVAFFHFKGICKLNISINVVCYCIRIFYHRKILVMQLCPSLHISFFSYVQYMYFFLVTRGSRGPFLKSPENVSGPKSHL